MCEEENKVEEEIIEDEVIEEASETEALNEEILQLRDKLLRQTAEFENFRKRTAKEKESLFMDGQADCAAAFLPLVDNLERFYAATKEEAEDSPMRQGIEKVLKQLGDILKALSVTEIPALGEKFDPEVHNAVMHIEDETVDDATIVEEFQKGYKFGDKVLRFSMVKVAN